MKIAIVGAGFTGLASAYKLSSQNHDIFIFEKEKDLGGLAQTFKMPGWSWNLEKHYHHWFTNDTYAINLIKELNLEKYLIFPKTQTSLFLKGRNYPFNSPTDVLKFSPLSVLQRLRTGLITLYLKLLPLSLGQKLEKYTAWEWLEKYYGTAVFNLIWQPLLLGKFGPYSQKVNMSWFWARIKKRTPRLGYLRGGYNRLLTALIQKIRENGGKIYLETPFNPGKRKEFDKIIITTPSTIFAKMFPELPQSYKRKLTAIPHLHALNLVLISKDKFLPDTYWLNINEKNFPFIGVIQQTNLIDHKHYNGNHLTWVANYLPENHPFLKMTKEELLKIYLPYLQKINPSFNFELLTLNLPAQAGFELFMGPFAQPVFMINYSRSKPSFTTPLDNVYLANMDMVYPWDRGTNYAIELGFNVATKIMST